MNHRPLLQLVAGVLGAFALAIQAATFTVTRADDPLPDGCVPSDCSLREAVIAANASPGADLIQLPSATVLLTRSGAGGAELGDLDVSGPLTIQGVEASLSIIDGTGAMRIFDLAPGSMVTLESLTLRNGQPGTGEGGNGGCIQAQDAQLTLKLVTVRDCVGSNGGGIDAGNTTLTLDQVVIRDNIASIGGGAHVRVLSAAGERVFSASNLLMLNNQSGNSGAGLYLIGATLRSEIHGAIILGNQTGGSFNGGGIHIGSGGSGGGRLTLAQVHFTNNRANDGGALFIADAEVIGERVTFQDNHADDQGGAARILATTGSLSLTESLARGNSADFDGGAFRVNFGQLHGHNLTVSGNSAPRGGALYAESGATVTMLHATIADNVSSADGNGSSIARINSSDTTVTWASSILSGGCTIFSGNASYASLGGNLEGPGNGCGLNQASDLVNRSAAQLGLSALALGGGTWTHAIAATSQARDHALPALCPPIDQRHALRLGALAPPLHCDAGAHEFGGVPLDYLFRSDFEP